MKTTLIFDFDGTLINTHSLIVRGLDHFSLMHRGISIPTNVHESILGKPLDFQLQVATGFCNDALLEEFKTWYATRHDLLATPFPGVTELIHYLKANHYKLAIVTNNSRECLNMGLKLLGLENQFDITIAYEDVQNRKPDPEGLHLAMSRLNVTPENCYFVGDSESDLGAGQQAGIDTLLVGWTFQNRQQLLQYSPAYVIEHPLEIAEILLLLSTLSA